MCRKLCSGQQATDEVLTLHKAFVKFSGYGALSLTWYALEDTARAIGTLVADTVPLKAWRRGGDPTNFYPPPKSKRVARYPAKRARAEGDSGDGGGEISLAEAAGNEAEEGAEQEDEVELSDAEDAPGDLENYLEEVMGDMLQPFDAVVEGADQLVAAEQAVVPEGASAQGEPPPPPAPRPSAPPGEEARPRGRGAETVVFPWGKITYYASKRSFEAICRNPAHGKCVLTRSAKGRKAEPLGGRPLGFMAAWLQQGHVASKEAHWSPEVLHSSLAARVAGRNFVKAASQELDLLSYERPRADAGEDSEAEDASAYI